MKFQIVNDLHIEGRGAPGIENAADVLVVAGDLCDWPTRLDGVDFLNWQAQDRDLVIFTLGNHEYYHGEVNEVEHFWHNECANLLADNVHVLVAGDTVDYENCTFIGDTLWTDLDHGKAAAIYATGLNDCGLTKGLTPERVCKRNHIAKVILDHAVHKNVDRKVVMVTHHLPMKELITPRFAGDALNPCFANYDDWARNLLHWGNIKAWHFGHTHDQINVNLYDCQFVCNAGGYYYEHAGFDPAFIVEV
jgi:hypothetical protein